MFLVLILSVSILITLICFLYLLTPQPNDDTYVYFTYAKNFIEGRFLAYDHRNIPSEGFSSLLYLLMLVPFEFFGVNMIFAAQVLSLIGLAISILISAMIFVRSEIIPKKMFAPFIALFTAIILTSILISNNNMLTIIGKSVETTWAPVFVLLGVFFITETLINNSLDLKRIKLFTFGFFVSAFLSYLIRPENILIMAAMGAYFLLFNNNKKRLMIYTFYFALFFLGYLALKYFIFGDIFPTGYYRKLSAEQALPGFRYVRECFNYYQKPVYFIIAGLAIGALYIVLNRKNSFQDFLKKIHPFVLCVIGAVINLLFILRVTPIIGYGFRFLYIYIFTMYMFLCLTMILIISLYAILLKTKVGAEFINYILIPVILITVPCISLHKITKGKSISSVISGLNLYTKSVVETDAHHYLKFGRFLKERLPDHKNMTLIFGDAGAIPYALECKFLDTNGLTEPYIAHLFQESDSEEKVKRYTDYILKHDPDIIVLAFGDPVGDKILPKPNLHSPFRKPQIGKWKAYQEYGFKYIVSLPMYDTLHIGVNLKSPSIKPLSKALLEYGQRHSGYIMNDGLNIEFKDGSVHFDRYLPKI